MGQSSDELNPLTGELLSTIRSRIHKIGKSKLYAEWQEIAKAFRLQGKVPPHHWFAAQRVLEERGSIPVKGPDGKFYYLAEEKKAEGSSPAVMSDGREKTPEPPVSAVNPQVATAPKSEMPVRSIRSPLTLRKKAEFESMDAAPSKVVDWVFNNMGIEDVEPTDAPSPGAWGLLERCRQDVTSLDNFLKNTWPKMLPQRTQQELVHTYEDDGRKIEGFCRDIERMHDEAMESVDGKERVEVG